jgi:hypothetical protein
MFTEIDTMVHATSLVRFERWQVGLGGGFRFLQESSGECLKFGPSRPWEWGVMNDLTQETSPFDKDSIDVAGAEDGGDETVSGMRVAMDRSDDQVGSMAVLGRYTVF